MNGGLTGLERHEGGNKHLSELRIVLMGHRRSGKSSTGNTILGSEGFDLERSAQCARRRREVGDRHITVIEAPGWWRSYSVDLSSELLKQEIVLSMSLCPPGPHVVLLLIRADIHFEEAERKALKEHLDLLGKRIWSHTIVLFTHGDSLFDTSIEQHIESKGQDLQRLLDKCGNRYHVFNNQNKNDNTQIKGLLEKIEETVTQNNGHHFEADGNILKQMIERKRTEKARARKRMKRIKEQRDDIRSQMGGNKHLSELRIVLMGHRRSGKSSTGNTILGSKEFDLERSAQCVRRRGEVEDRHITVIEAPGWWRKYSVDSSLGSLRKEILQSVSLCPPGPQAVLLFIRADLRFKKDECETLQGYLDLLGEKVWSHTIVLFTFGDSLLDTSIEQHIESEGQDLQWLLDKCGNRYHVFNNQNKSDNTQIKELIEKIEEMVTLNNGHHFEIEESNKNSETANQTRTKSWKMPVSKSCHSAQCMNRDPIRLIQSMDNPAPTINSDDRKQSLDKMFRNSFRQLGIGSDNRLGSSSSIISTESSGYGSLCSLHNTVEHSEHKCQNSVCEISEHNVRM